MFGDNYMNKLIKRTFTQHGRDIISKTHKGKILSKDVKNKISKSKRNRNKEIM